MRLILLAFLIGVAVLTGCNEDKILINESGPPFEADWTGTYVDTNSALRPLRLSLKVDTSSAISGTYSMEFIDTLGTLITVSGVATGQATSDTTGAIFLENDAFRWRLSGSITPPFRFSGSWVALFPSVGFGNFSVTK